MIDPTNRNQVERFFRNQNTNDANMDSLNDIKSNFKAFQDYDISDEVLTIHYMINEEDEMTEYPLEDFLYFCQDECPNPEDYIVYVMPDKDDVGVNDNGMVEMFDADTYIGDNEKDLVIDFFSKHK